jgi:hypothetical protein
MSLINDALKRARESQRKDPPSGASPLPPIEHQSGGGTGWILVAVVVLLLAAACLFIGSALFGHKAPPVAVLKVPEISTPKPVEPAPMTAPAPVIVTNALPSPVINTGLPPSSTNANPPPAIVAPEQKLKLQGIIFSAVHPLAIVNGKTINVGDSVGDLQVIQILKNSVIFQRPDGSQKTLGIGE